MTTRSRRRWSALGLVTLAFGCTPKHTAEAPARPVRVEAVREEAAEAGLRYSASIQPQEQVALAFKAAGYVRELREVTGVDGRRRHVQQGDAVARGALLARVNPADYEERVKQAQAQLDEAEAGLKRARADAARAESLYAQKALTRTDYDAATAAQAAAAARADAARAQLESARIARDDTALRAPFDGVVLARNVELGALAGAGTVGFVLADLKSVKAVFGVPDRVVPRVRVGTRLDVTSDAFAGATFAGRVSAVAPAADSQSRVFGVEVTIPNPRGQLKAGMVATVEIASPEAPDVPAGARTVSVSAVVKSERSSGYAVFVVEGPDDAARARSRDVSLGRIAGNRVAVEDGLRVGERVVVSGAGLLADGERVRVIPGDEGR